MLAMLTFQAQTEINLWTGICSEQNFKQKKIWEEKRPKWFIQKFLAWKNMNAKNVWPSRFMQHLWAFCRCVKCVALKWVWIWKKERVTIWHSTYVECVCGISLGRDKLLDKRGWVTLNKASFFGAIVNTVFRLDGMESANTNKTDNGKLSVSVQQKKRI